MRVAALYDIHGNLPALEAALDEALRARVDEIVVGGDLIPGPMSREALTCLLDLDVPARFIQGNGEVAVLAVAEGDESSIPEHSREVIRWTAQQLDATHRETIARWPKTLRLVIPGVGNVLFCHATPRDENECFTRLTPERKLLPIFEGRDASVVVCGHTHMQFDRKVGSVRVVNAGSVGMPFGNPGAHWLLLGPAIELRRTTYDLDAAAERIRRTTYPQAREFAERNVLQPPTETAMLDIFARAELNI
jgi:predicted phosphodiesterase